MIGANYTTSSDLTENHYTKTTADDAVAAAITTFNSSVLGADYTNTSDLNQFYYTKTNADAATAGTVESASAAIFADMTGLPIWDVTTAYSVDARVVHKASSTSANKVYKALRATAGHTPHTNLTGGAPYWALDTLAFAGALDTLDATVNADGSGLVEKTNAIQLRIDGVGTATMEQKFATHTDDINGLSNQYSVKIDNNGAVAGFGLSSTGRVGNITSEFIVNADRFAIVSNASNPNTATTPFVVQATATTLNGVAVPAGVYMTDAFIRNGSIVSAKIGELSADKITTDFIRSEVIGAGTIDASKINLDNSTITSGTVNGVPNTVIIKSLGVKTAQIDELAVKTVKIDNQAVTIPDSGGGSVGVDFTTGQVTLATMRFTSSGAPIFINASSFVKNSRSDRGCSFYYRLYRGPTKLVEHNIMITAVDISSGAGSCASISYLDNPGAGIHVYRLKAVRQSLQAGQVITAAENWITGLEVKK